MDIASKFRRGLAMVGIAIKGSADEADTTSPTITSGSGAPTATEPANSFYLRSDGSDKALSLYSLLVAVLGLRPFRATT